MRIYNEVKEDNFKNTVATLWTHFGIKTFESLIDPFPFRFELSFAIDAFSIFSWLSAFYPVNFDMSNLHVTYCWFI